MTDEPTPTDQPVPAAAGGNAPQPGLPPESRAARSLTDRSKAEEPHTHESDPEPVSGPRLWPRVVGVLILLIGAGGVWIWQNPGFVQSSLRSLFPGTAGHDTGAAEIKALETRVTRLEQRPS